MRALRWHGERDVRLEDVPVPVVGAGDALVRIERVGLCGSDVEQYLSGITVDPGAAQSAPAAAAGSPLILGHELVGVVETCESRPELVGARVVPDVVTGCGSCWWCVRNEAGLCPSVAVSGQTADGGLAEYFVCEAARLVLVPDHVAVNDAAFAEPLAVAVRAIEKAGDLRGSVVAVLGMGVIGNLIAQLCLLRGASVTGIDIAAHRRELSSTVGVTAVAPADAATTVAAVADGGGANVVFECAGHPATFATSSELCRAGGTVVLVGISAERPPFEWRDAVLRELRFVGSAAHIWDTDVQSAVNLIATGSVRLAPLTSQVTGLAGVDAALQALAAPNTLAKILVDPAAE